MTAECIIVRSWGAHESMTRTRRRYPLPPAGALPRCPGWLVPVGEMGAGSGAPCAQREAGGVGLGVAGADVGGVRLRVAGRRVDGRRPPPPTLVVCLVVVWLGSL